MTKKYIMVDDDVLRDVIIMHRNRIVVKACALHNETSCAGLVKGIDDVRSRLFDLQQMIKEYGIEREIRGSVAHEQASRD